jgi:hypothetical protein
MQILNSFRNWLIVFLGGKPQDAGAADKATEAQDVAYRESSTPVVFDESLFERSRTQWHFGDWTTLASLQRETIQNHPQRAKLALLAAAGRLQTDAEAEAREYLVLAKEWGCTKTLISQVLISGVHNSLGRAASVMGDHAKALEHFGASVATATPGNDAVLLTQARYSEQVKHIGKIVTSQKSSTEFELTIK